MGADGTKVYNYNALEEAVENWVRFSNNITSQVSGMEQKVNALISNGQFSGSAATSYQGLAQQINKTLNAQSSQLQAFAIKVQQLAQEMASTDSKTARRF